ncbi:hypothetical protein GCM10025771_39720 [Niveibacterium umoris]|nr:amino acid adenylation domain-containing protein [Niveibacterium umoris]
MLPLSLSQHEVWLDQRAWPDNAHLVIGGCLHMRGPLDVARMQQALDRMVCEYEVLRLVPHESGGQHLLESYRAPLIEVDASGADDVRTAVQAWWAKSLQTPYRLDDVPLWRFAVLHFGPLEHCALIQFHHLVMDGWGTTQIIRRWSEHYAALASGEAPPVAQQGHYLRFIEESTAYRNAPEFDKDAAFWQSQLPSLPAALFDRHAPAAARDVPSDTRLPASRLSRLPLDRASYQRIADAACGPGQTAFCVFLAALALYFCRVRDLQDVVIGVPSLNRNGKRYKETPGMFVGVMPVRIAVAPDDTAASLIATVSRNLRAALRHARYPLSEVARHLHAIRSHRDSLFDVLLSYERQGYAVSFGEAHAVGSWQLFPGVARYPLGMTVCEFDEDGPLDLVLEGSSACFDEGEIDLLSRRLRHVICELADAPERRLAELDIVPRDERDALVTQVHARLRHTADPQTFVSQFESHAARTPDAVALVWDEGSMSYAQLDRSARALAHTLRRAGARADTVVAVCMGRSADAIVAMLAVAKAGAAFLPLDVDAPDARLALILAESAAIAVLTAPGERQRLSALHGKVIVVGATTIAPPQAPDWPAPSARDLAYVLFTSGSTGRPKGVMVAHEALARRVAWLGRTWAITRDDRAAQSTQLTFDPALIEWVVPLTHGASVALPPSGRLAPESTAAFAAQHGVTLMAFVPSTLRRFLDGARGLDLRLRVACCGGDVLTPALARRFISETGARLFNVYGPTEACIFATAWECSADTSDAVLPVGRPVDDSRVYVLDAQRRPVPFGCQGDVYLGGGTLARGYLNRTDLDAQAFCGDPFVAGGRLYRTGDRGKIAMDGTLHFLGRSDRQIKLRGYRIEPAEVEAALLAFDGVNQAAVRLVDTALGQRLYAWVGSGLQDSATISRHLRSRLPDYMLPSGITLMPALPLNNTGKIDYTALPEPLTLHVGEPGRAPRSPLEQDLLGLWEATLNRRDIGIDDDFFELGGDSLAAVDILSGVQRLTGKQASLLTLTEHPSVAELAEALASGVKPSRLMLPLGAQSGDTTLFLAASGHGDLLRFQTLAHALGPRVRLFMLQPPPDGFSGVSDLAARYADEMANTTSGAINIAGFSVGGIAALEAARLLQARGRAVERLILIDTVFPSGMLRRPRFWRLLAWLTRRLYVQELSMNGRRLGAMFADTGLVSQVMALHDYRPQAFAGRACLIKSSGLANWDRWLFRPWLQLSGERMTVRQIAGLHGSVFDADHVDGLAAALLAEVFRDN